MKIRTPAVSGKFYPSDQNELNMLIIKILESEKKQIKNDLAKTKIIGAILPHAGFIFSGYQAVHFFEILKQSETPFDTFVIINPNHTGYGEEISLDENDFWETPFGTTAVDKEMAELILFPYSSDAHRYEHSGEVMLPFLQYFLNYKFKILPITLSKQNIYNSKLIASRIHFAAKKLNRKICFIASSDFSHYVHPDFGKIQDFKVIEKILSLDSEGIIETVKNNRISMCGYGPAAALIEYALIKSETPKAELLKFGHSGEIYKSEQVVDYASILVYE
jgi:AmmeMemoRadiSam system protein B